MKENNITAEEILDGIEIVKPTNNSEPIKMGSNLDKLNSLMDELDKNIRDTCIEIVIVRRLKGEYPQKTQMLLDALSCDVDVITVKIGDKFTHKDKKIFDEKPKVENEDYY